MPESVTTRRLQMARRSAQKKPSSRKMGKNRETELPSDVQKITQSHHLTGMKMDSLQMTHFAAAQGCSNQLPLYRLWSFGFRIEAISSIMMEFPPSIRFRIQQSLETWDQIIREIGQPSSKSTFGLWIHTDLETDNFDQQSHLLLNDPQHSIESSYAILTMKFDSTSQRRTEFWFNRAAADLFGMSEAELHSRLACYDLNVPFPDLDAVSAFLHLLLGDLAASSAVRVKHLRFDTGSKGSDRFRLVRWSTVSCADSSGTTLEVRRAPAARR